jgi:hypothetical protein
MTFAQAFHEGLVLTKICHFLAYLRLLAWRDDGKFGILLHVSDCFRRIWGAYGTRSHWMDPEGLWGRLQAMQSADWHCDGVSTHG